MKILLGAALAVAVFAAPAFAQTTPTPPTPPTPVPASACGALPAVPALPDGATASRQDMEGANTTYQAWYEQYAANVRCRHDEAESLRAQYDARLAEHNAAVEAVNAANASWTAEAEEFNARNERRRR